eukprot:283938-Pyramimonas_sp.AAC.1
MVGGAPTSSPTSSFCSPSCSTPGGTVSFAFLKVCSLCNPSSSTTRTRLEWPYCGKAHVGVHAWCLAWDGACMDVELK